MGAGRLLHDMDGETAQLSADAIIAAVASRQHGLVAYRQLLAAGIGRGAIEHRIRTGRLIRVQRGVYAVGHVHESALVRRMAAVLTCGDGALLSHLSALAHWELRGSAQRLHVTVPRRNGSRSRAGIVVHRSLVLPPSETATHRAIAVTSVARSLLDGAAILAPHALSRAVERSEILRLFDLTAVEHTLRLHRTHPGSGRLRSAIELFRDDEITRSDLEAMMLGICAAHALPRPLVNHVVEGDEVDFFFREQRLIVETDGRETHLTRAAFERDRARDAHLAVAGYRVVRFTYRRILRDSGAVAATLRALVAEPASQPWRSMSSIR